VKFVHDIDGKLVRSENHELKTKIAELETQLDAQSSTQRADTVARIRRVLVESEKSISAEDESVLALYLECVIEFHNVEGHFGPRLITAMSEKGRGNAA